MFSKRIEKLSPSLTIAISQKARELKAQGRDILAQSKTGSGKTLAFGIPSIAKADLSNKNPQTLIITPTRELASQIATELRKVASYRANLKIVTLYGGVPLRSQADSLKQGANIIIGTPGRLNDLLGKGELNLSCIKRVVLDEADRMLDMGFFDDIIKIVKKSPKDRQTLLFSATFPDDIEDLAKSLLREPLTIKVANQDRSNIEEILYESEDRYKTLTSIIGSYKPNSMLIFVNKKSDAVSLSERLIKRGDSAIDIQGDLEQIEREESIIAFSNGSKRVLVATDVASRGIDIKDIDIVVNYNLPWDEELYIHRIGRTGRLEASGTAISILSKDDSQKCDFIKQRAIKRDIKELKVDSKFRMKSKYETICLNGGKKNRLRAGDILGTLCKEIGINGKNIGKIDIKATKSYIAIDSKETDRVLKALKSVKIKKRKYIAWVI